MKSYIMKKILLIVALVLVGLNANAWNSQLDEAIVILSTKYLSPRSKLVVENFLGKTYADDVAYLDRLDKQKRSPYSRDVHYLHLDANLQPLAVEGDDAIKALNQAAAVLVKYETLPKKDIVAALRTIINLMCDMNNLSRIRIQGVDYSWQDFKVNVQRSASGSKMKETAPTKWSGFWNAYFGYHKGFYPALWAEDIDVCHGAQFAQFTQGTLNDWASQNGAVAMKLFSGSVKPEGLMTRVERLELEDLHCEMMAKAAFRLAAFLNYTLR